MAKKKELTSNAAVIKKRKETAEIRQGYVQLFIRIILLIVLGLLLFTQVFLIKRVSGNEMFPAIKDGDLLIGFRLQRQYEQENVVVYTVDGVQKVGRIVALAGDVVDMDDSGTLVVNGTVKSGDIAFPTYAKEGTEYPYRVPDDCVYILSDYRTQAEDSRDFGAVQTKNVQCKVISLLRRRGL